MTSFFDFQKGITGSHFFHYGSCPTRLWLYHRNIEVGKDNDHIQIGRYLDETTHLRNRKSLVIDGVCQIDYLENNGHMEVHEIKKGKKMSEAIRLQVMFYLLVIKQYTGEVPLGFVHFPQARKVVNVNLSENEVINAINEIRRIVNGPCPPPLRIPICRGCAYSEMCWA